MKNFTKTKLKQNAEIQKEALNEKLLGFSAKYIEEYERKFINSKLTTDDSFQKSQYIPEVIKTELIIPLHSVEVKK